MNWRKDIYIKLCEALKPLKDNGKLLYIDLDKGQFDEPKKSYPVSRPAVLITIARGEKEHMTTDYIEGNATIVLHLIMNNRYASFEGNESYDESLDVLDLIDEVVNHAVFTIGDTFDALSYDSEERLPYEYDGLQKHSISFSTQLHYQLNRV